MSDNERLLKQAEGLAGWRRIMLVVNACSYAVWIIAFSLGMTGIGNLPHSLLITIALVVLPVWAVSLFALVWGIRRLARDRQLRALIDDERTCGLSKRAFQAGYWSLLVAITGLYVASFLIEIDLQLAIPFLMAVGVSAPSLTYAILYRS